TLQCVD
ncbi:hypothetical protein BVZ75_01051B, partial [Haemophilus influenzae]